MNKEKLYNADCAVLFALNIIGGKWRLPILWKLIDCSLRYNELKRQIHGITNVMLTRSLQDLEEHGLIRRIQFSEIPPHVEYSLTEQGQKLIPAMHGIQKWGEEQMSFCELKRI